MGSCNKFVPYSNDSLINTKPLFFNSHKENYEGKFWASKPGKLDYEIEIFDQENSRIVSRGEIQVQESQIELNKVFLNELPLKKLVNKQSEKTKEIYVSLKRQRA